MDFVHIVAEDKIRKAIEDGEFDHLPGKGQPLVLDDMAGISPELRMAYKMLINAGMLEEENDYRKEMMRIEDLIASCDEDAERKKLQKQLNEKLLSFNKVMKKRNVSNSNAFKQYQHKIDRLFE
ncbi:DnaJ family domain-containing protein [Peribacillus glennii]|uniref:DUF1992 domain-containing protein n=1 Tax=Peribacillus glennii TaxID=2303991 RepID=A0A372LBT7_9BACI|nr:DnaJ family domain-containing protein [Peribacillus glennii]RFU62920.1 DUF1992 domain-containing protein [Peribacillus glennii]